MSRYHNSKTVSNRSITFVFETAQVKSEPTILSIMSYLEVKASSSDVCSNFFQVDHCAKMNTPSKATGQKPYQDMDAGENNPLTGHLGQTEKYSRFKPRQPILPWFISLLLLIALVYSRISTLQTSDNRGSWRMTELGITCPYSLSSERFSSSV